MTVYAVFRRGNFLYALLLALLPAWLTPEDGWVRRFVRSLTRDTWMACSLQSTAPCSRGVGRSCEFCTLHGSAGGRRYHVLTVTADDENEVRAVVDASFPKPEAWLFVRLDRVSEASAQAFFREVVAGKGFNFNRLYNFVPCCGTHGLRDNNHRHAGTFFCSEMLTAFVQANGYDMGLVPCKTSPQMLAVELIARFPELEQFGMDSEGVLYPV